MKDTVNIESFINRICNGYLVSLTDIYNIISKDIYEILFIANSIRRYFKKDYVRLCSIINAKSGFCSQDCKFCAQSIYYKTNIKTYPIVDLEVLKVSFEKALNSGVRCFSIVTSGRSPSNKELEIIFTFLKDLSLPDNMTISASLGELDLNTLLLLKECGLKKYHHNLETAESHFSNICTTHTYQDRIRTIINAKRAGLEICAGGIIGMGENIEQRIELAFALKSLGVDSIPINFLHPINGTPFEGFSKISPMELLKTIAIFRIVNPDKDIIVCGGREFCLGELQSWIFFAGANGVMTGNYLTTSGRNPLDDIRMIEDLGLKLDRCNLNYVQE